jgi:hypothetical protein
MKGDRAPLTDECPVIQEIASHTRIRMVAVDEKQVEFPPCESGANPRNHFRRLGRAAEIMQALPGPRKVAQARLSLYEQIYADHEFNFGEGVREEKIRASVRHADFAHHLMPLRFQSLDETEYLDPVLV